MPVWPPQDLRSAGPFRTLSDTGASFREGKLVYGSQSQNYGSGSYYSTPKRPQGFVEQQQTRMAWSAKLEADYRSRPAVADVEKRAGEMYDAVVTLLENRYRAKDLKEYEVPWATFRQLYKVEPGTPKTITNAVVARLKEAGFAAKRHHNYGNNFYDHIEITPSEDLIGAMLSKLRDSK